MPEPLPTDNAPLSIDDVRKLTAEDMQKVDQLIIDSLQSDVALINQLSSYLIHSGGKRLRPLLLLLVAKAFNYQHQHHYTLAAVIEFIHTATLLHDDVVDASKLRRGKQTANSLWGNEASVLVGDFLYSRAFQMMVGVQSMRVMDVLSDATNIIAEGEVLQLLNCHEPDTSEQQYLTVIHCKTAKLFEAATRLGAIISQQPPEVETAMADYGKYLGTAFQLIDDVLDYSSDSDEIGKNIGDDLAEGKPTLPLIYALSHGNAEQQALIRDAITHGGREHITAVTEAIQATHALAYTAEVAKQEAEKAINCLKILPDSPYTDALYALANFSVQRSY